MDSCRLLRDPFWVPAAGSVAAMNSIARKISTCRWVHTTKYTHIHTQFGKPFLVGSVLGGVGGAYLSLKVLADACPCDKAGIFLRLEVPMARETVEGFLVLGNIVVEDEVNLRVGVFAPASALTCFVLEERGARLGSGVCGDISSAPELIPVEVVSSDTCSTEAENSALGCRVCCVLGCRVSSGVGCSVSLLGPPVDWMEIWLVGWTLLGCREGVLGDEVSL
jgi:hypothetical protein